MDDQTELLTRVVARLRPYISDGAIRRSRLERVLASIAGDTGHLASGVRARLDQAGVVVVDDVAPAQKAPDGRPPYTDSVDASVSPVDTRQASAEGLSNDAAIAVARARIRVDRQTLRPERVILNADEEIGLAMLVRGDAGVPLPPGGFGRLDGEARAAAECLLLHNQRLIHSIARRFHPPGLTDDDVFQHGVLGLIRAVEMFDPALDFKFSTYATNWIRQAITAGIANESRLIRLPVHMFERVAKVWAEREKLTMNGIPPSARALAEACELTVEQVKDCLALGDPTISSLDQPIGEGETVLGDVLPVESRDASPDESLLGSLLKETIDEVLSGLSDAEADVICRRVGLREFEEQTLQEIGDSYGVSRERIRQIESKALEKLRHERRSSRLRMYM